MSKKFFCKYFICFVLSFSMIIMSACGNSVSIPDEYNYDDFSKFIKLADYKNVEYTPVDSTVSQDEIDNYINQVLNQNATDSKKIKSGVAKKDSIANIDYVGSIDGVEFDGGAGENYNLDLANSTFIPGFAEEIVGHSVGETFDVNVTFPKDYDSADLAGKPAVFVTTINYLTEKIVPEYNLDFVKENTDFDSIEDYENDVKEKLTQEKKSQLEQMNMENVFHKIVEASKVIKYPDAEYKARLETIAEKKDTKQKIKEELVLHAIAQREGLEFTDSDFQQYINALLDEAGVSVDDVESQIGMPLADYVEQNRMFDSFIFKEVMEKVMSYAVVK